VASPALPAYFSTATRRTPCWGDVRRHRAPRPDDEGHFVSAHVGLGMRRLSVIDVAAGQQPIGNEDGSVQIVFNGEIYNHRALRDQLEQRGHRFATHSDTRSSSTATRSGATTWSRT
jgi:asparagine synthetase B (glutamine-hydrolysing)